MDNEPLDPETAWQREIARAKAIEEANAAIADIDRMLAERDPAAAERAKARRAAAEAPEQKPRAAEPRQRPTAQPQPAASHTEWSASWNKWCQTVADQQIAAFKADQVIPLAHAVGDDVAGLKKRIGALETTVTELRAEIVATEKRVREALSSEIRIAALEVRLENAERRAAPTPLRSRLGEDDADAVH